MKKFRLLSLALALAMTVTTFASCGGNKEPVSKGEGNAADVNTTVGQEENTQADIVDSESAFTVKKIGSVEADYIYSLSEHGIIYNDENDKYGVMSPDGTHNSGAKYLSISEEGRYFTIETVAEKNPDDISTLNSIGLIDTDGKEIIPAKYAVIEELNDRFYRACEVTEKTSDEDAYLVYFTSNMFSLSADEDDILYKGVWYIYDVTTGKPVEGATGTNRYMINAYGNTIKYVTDAEEEKIVNEKGEELPAGIDVLENGYYVITEGSTGTVYDENNKKAFDFDTEDFVPNYSEGDYLRASKYVNDVRTFVYMDKSGKRVSAEFTETPMLYGELVESGEKIYTLDGTVVNEGPVSYVYYEETYGETWWLKNEDTYTMIDKDGNVLYEGTSEDPYYCDTSAFSISKKTDGNYTYYSMADKDFTISGSPLNSTWLFKVKGTNDFYTVTESLSGAAIIKGYKNYNSVDVPGDCSYIYADNDDGTYDIYTVEK